MLTSLKDILQWQPGWPRRCHLPKKCAVSHVPPCLVQGDILEDIVLIENLQETKRTALDIAEKVKQAQETSEKLGKAREVYRPVAARGSLMYFLVDALNALDRIYHYSMANFVAIMHKGRLPASSDVQTQYCLTSRIHVLSGNCVLTFCAFNKLLAVSSRYKGCCLEQ